MDSRSLEKKLSAVKESSEDIQAVSRWCIQHRSQHHSIVQAWSRAIRKAKVGHRLTLFYVCNDVVQNARRKKCPELVQYFGTAIKEAAPLVREDKIRKKILRIFKIWEERGIYDTKLVTEFTNIVEKVGTVNSTENDVVLSTFQLEQLVESVQNLVALERTSQNLLADLKTQEHMLTEEEIQSLRLTVKERGASRERLEEFEESVSSLEFYINSLQNEIDERTKAVTLLEQAEIFYETQRGEAKLVSTAYKNFHSQVKFLKKKLTEKLPSLPEPLSPVPTPPLDAPSPQSDIDDINFEDTHENSEELSSFLNSNTMPAFAEKVKESMTSDKTTAASYESEFDRLKSPVISRSASKERTLEEEQQDFEMQIANFSKPRKSYMEAKPMNAKELLDTFGKSISSPASTTPTSFQIPASVPPIPPLPPDPTMVMASMASRMHMPPSSSSSFHQPHSGLTIPLPPAPPPAPPNIPLPQAFLPPPLPPHPVRLEFPPPLPQPRQYHPYVSSGPPAVRAPWSDTWMPLPPPPPPPPPINVKETKIAIEDDWAKEQPQFTEEEWNAYHGIVDEEPPEDEDCDNRNWGEPPGTEELQTFEQLQAAAEEEKASFLIPPPPPPQFSSLPRDDDEINSPQRHSNLVNIEPRLVSDPAMSNYGIDYHSLSTESSFIKNNLFNTGDTDMRVIPGEMKRNGEESGSDMDISEGENSDYERPRRHKRDSSSKDISRRPDESTHKPVSFSLSKGSKPLIPISGNTRGFNQDDDENFGKRSLPMPPSYIKRQKLQERNTESENITASSIPVVSKPLIADRDANLAAKSFDIAWDRKLTVEKEPFIDSSVSEALGMYYDSDNDSDNAPYDKPDADEPSEIDNRKRSFEDNSSENNAPLEDISQTPVRDNARTAIKDSFQESIANTSQVAVEDNSPVVVKGSSPAAVVDGFPSATEGGFPSAGEDGFPSAAEDSFPSAAEDGFPSAADDSFKVYVGDNTQLGAKNKPTEAPFSQVIESFISETRADECPKESYDEPPYMDECLQEDKQIPDTRHSPPHMPYQPHEGGAHVFERVQPISAMYSSPPPVRPYGGPEPFIRHRGQGNFYQGRPRGRGFSPRPPFHGGRGGFRGRPFNSPMGPRWHPRGGRQPWW